MDAFQTSVEFAFLRANRMKSNETMSAEITFPPPKWAAS
jgi:hypothetical protein